MILVMPMASGKTTLKHKFPGLVTDVDSAYDLDSGIKKRLEAFDPESYPDLESYWNARNVEWHALLKRWVQLVSTPVISVHSFADALVVRRTPAEEIILVSIPGRVAAERALSRLEEISETPKRARFLQYWAMNRCKQTSAIDSKLAPVMAESEVEAKLRSFSSSPLWRKRAPGLV